MAYILGRQAAVTMLTHGRRLQAHQAALLDKWAVAVPVGRCYEPHGTARRLPIHRQLYNSGQDALVGREADDPVLIAPGDVRRDQVLHGHVELGVELVFPYVPGTRRIDDEGMAEVRTNASRRWPRLDRPVGEERPGHLYLGIVGIEVRHGCFDSFAYMLTVATWLADNSRLSDLLSYMSMSTSFTARFQTIHTVYSLALDPDRVSTYQVHMCGVVIAPKWHSE